MRRLKKQLGIATGIGAADVLANTAATSGYMHRELTHEAYKLHPKLKTLARTVIWGNGMIPREWAAVHRIHHEESDTPKDPHSPVQQGRFGILKLLARNPFLFRDSVKEVRKKPLPDDLQPDELDKKLFDNSKAGMAASLAGHVALNKAAGNSAAMAPVSWAIGKVGYVFAGNMVNAFGHAGKRPMRAVVTGEIEPHEDGTYGSDNAVIGTLTLGEGWQKEHHENPQKINFAPDRIQGMRRKIADPVGASVEFLMDHGLAAESERQAAA